MKHRSAYIAFFIMLIVVLISCGNDKNKKNGNDSKEDITVIDTPDAALANYMSRPQSAGSIELSAEFTVDLKKNPPPSENKTEPSMLSANKLITEGTLDIKTRSVTCKSIMEFDNWDKYKNYRIVLEHQKNGDEKNSKDTLIKIGDGEELSRIDSVSASDPVDIMLANIYFFNYSNGWSKIEKPFKDTIIVDEQKIEKMFQKYRNEKQRIELVLSEDGSVVKSVNQLFVKNKVQYKHVIESYKKDPVIGIIPVKVKMIQHEFNGDVFRECSGEIKVTVK